MRYQTEQKHRKYVEGYRFWSIARKCGNKYGKNTNGYFNKNRNRCCKNCF